MNNIGSVPEVHTVKSEAIADLKLFNEKAVVLWNSSFADATLRSQFAVMFSWEACGNYEAVLIGPEGESVDATFLTLRMFLQDNDRISIRNIAKLYSHEQELKPYQLDFDTTRDQINTFLESDNGINFSGNHYSNKELIELLLYGSKGHSNRAKESKLRKLLDSSISSPLYLNQVNFAVAQLIIGIAAVAEINQRALSSIELA